MFWGREKGIQLVPEDGPISELRGNLSLHILGPPPPRIPRKAHVTPRLLFAQKEPGFPGEHSMPKGQGGGRHPPPRPTEATQLMASPGLSPRPWISHLYFAGAEAT